VWLAAGAVVSGFEWLLSRAIRDRPGGGHYASGSSDLQDNARRALAMKQANWSEPDHPTSSTAGEGMRPLPNRDIAPSGALNEEGHRPVLERSRKVR
jgi:hypothetical protein